MNEKRELTRRDFVRGTACAGMGITLGMAHATAAPARQPAKSRVVVIRDAKALDDKSKVQTEVLPRMLDDGLKAFAGTASTQEAWKRYFQPEDKVTIKSNVMFAPTPPELVRAIMEGIATAGVAIDTIRVWDRNWGGKGPDQADPRTWDWRPGFDANSVSNAVHEATALVNVPRLMNHLLVGLGAALKNWAGAVTNINVRDKDVAFAIHGDSGAEMGMLNAIPAIRKKCRLIVVEALRPLCHGGPYVNPRYVWPYKGLVIGTDPVAVDSVCLKILQGRRDQIRGGSWPLSPPPKHVAIADTKYKLGTADMSKIEIVRLGWEEDAFV
ncbi:MAG: hypothetical protein AMJ84_05685 [Acidithiobacillales bacterium SM23_46]|nr:MAG: hypothetical protein AMJ84_05685 [Acidithiobacillales bacterium SM23_46]